MTYNKAAIYKYKEAHLEQYKESTQKAAAKWRAQNKEIHNLKSRNRMRIYNEWKILRNIDLF